MRLETTQMAEQVAKDSALALKQMLKPDGTFVYRYLLSNPQKTDALYNNIRHIGSVWLLLEIENSIGPVDGIREAAIKSGEYMIEHFFVPYGGSDFMLCVLDEGFVKLGGAGLALNVLCGLYDTTGKERYLELAKRIVAYVLKQKRDDGEFIHVRPYPFGPVNPSRSNFATGQALMGLMYYWQRKGEREVASEVMDSIVKLEQQHSGIKTKSHWMLYALEQAYRADSSQQIEQYARRIAKAIMQDNHYSKSQSLSVIACATEGLLAYDRLLEAAGHSQSSEPRRELLKHIHRNLNAMLKFYVGNGVFFETPARPEVRIDYIVHAGLCFLGYALQVRQR